MYLSAIDWVIVVLYFILSLAIGIYFTKRASSSISDFFLGGRNVPWYLAGVSMVATTFAADTPLAVTELVCQRGIAGNWLWWNMALGGMLTTFFFARLWHKANVLTELEFIELRYSGKAAAFLRGFKAVYMGLFMNSLIIGWVNVALLSILKVFFNIPDEDLIWYAAAAMLLVAFYSAMSGLLGVIATDFFQFILAMASCIVLAFIVVNSEKIGGIVGLKEKLPEWSLSFFPSISNSASTTELGTTFAIGIGSFLAYITIQWWASWYPGAEPGGGGYIAQRMMCTKNEKDAFKATLFFQIAHYCIRPWPWIIVALCTIVLYPELSMGDKKLGYVYAMKEFLPDGLKGLLLVAFLAAYMSTISTQLNWGASYLVNDLYCRFINQKAGQKKLIFVSRTATVLLMGVSLFVTTRINSISAVWEFIIECGAGLGLVLILRWYWWRINAWSEITATIAPFVAYGFSRFFLHWGFPNNFFFTVAFTTICWLVITFLTPATSQERLKIFYLRVLPGGFWQPVKTLTNTLSTKSELPNLLLCWFCSVILVYSILFLIGDIILMRWSEALIWGITSLLSILILDRRIKKIKTQ